MSSSIRWGISPGKWRLSEELLSSGISEVSRAWEQSDALLLFPFFASCLSAEWERQPGMAEGRENCALFQPLGSLFLELTQVPASFGALKEASLKAFLRLADTVSSKYTHMNLRIAAGTLMKDFPWVWHVPMKVLVGLVLVLMNYKAFKKWYLLNISLQGVL